MSHTILTLSKLQEITGPIKAGSKQESNANAMLVGLNTAGFKAGLHKPHRLAIYLGQLLHESQVFRYDREIWGNTKAQKRYDVRTDLGNTPERDGDGYTYRGRGPIQITGKANYLDFTAWARKLDRKAPDFVQDPDAVNTDPWEGMVAIWYWTTRNLNRQADKCDVRGVTTRINGGLNGLDDRQKWTDRSSLVLLGYDCKAVSEFQKSAAIGVDGKLGPQTREALHAALLKCAPAAGPSRRPTGKQAGTAAAGGVGIVALAVSFWEHVQTAIGKAVCAVDFLGLFSCGGG